MKIFANTGRSSTPSHSPALCTWKFNGTKEKWKETFQTHSYLPTLSTVYFDGDFFLFIDINHCIF